MNEIKLIKVVLNYDTMKKFNINKNDFYQLQINGEIKSPTYYRQHHNFFNESDLKNNYFILLKQIEDIYPDVVTKDNKRKLHYGNYPCVIDNNGNEVYVGEEYSSIFLLGGEILLENPHFVGSDLNIINLKNNNLIIKGKSLNYFKSKNYIFVENRYDTDKIKRGVYQIDVLTGEYIVHPS